MGQPAEYIQASAEQRESLRGFLAKGASLASYVVVLLVGMALGAKSSDNGYVASVPAWFKLNWSLRSHAREWEAFAVAMGVPLQMTSNHQTQLIFSTFVALSAAAVRQWRSSTAP